MRCSPYLTLDQTVVFSVARITGVGNLPLRVWSSSKKHQLLLTWAPGPGVEPGSRGHKADTLPLSYPHIPFSDSIVIFGDTTVLEQPVSINSLHCCLFTVIVHITTPFSDFIRSTGTRLTVAPTTARTRFPTSGLLLPSPPVAWDGTPNGLLGLHRHAQRPR